MTSWDIYYNSDITPLCMYEYINHMFTITTGGDCTCSWTAYTEKTQKQIEEEKQLEEDKEKYPLFFIKPGIV